MPEFSCVANGCDHHRWVSDIKLCPPISFPVPDFIHGMHGCDRTTTCAKLLYIMHVLLSLSVSFFTWTIAHPFLPTTEHFYRITFLSYSTRLPNFSVRPFFHTMSECQQVCGKRCFQEPQQIVSLVTSTAIISFQQLGSRVSHLLLPSLDLYMYISFIFEPLKLPNNNKDINDPILSTVNHPIRPIFFFSYKYAEIKFEPPESLRKGDLSSIPSLWSHPTPVFQNPWKTHASQAA